MLLVIRGLKIKPYTETRIYYFYVHDLVMANTSLNIILKVKVTKKKTKIFDGNTYFK